jgi:hypothetical protein
MKRILLKSCTLALGFTLGCYEKATPVYGVVDTAYRDLDGDGWPADQDCDDGDAEVHPEAVEVCDDEVDNDCDEAVDGEDSDCQDG